MTAIRSIDLRFVKELIEFERGRGCVLDFSNPRFSDFFAAELDVNIDVPIYAENGGSKGKRLRCFLQKVDGAAAVRTLQALWEHRVEFLARTNRTDPFVDAEGCLLSLIARLTDRAERDAGGQAPVPATDRRLQAELRNGLIAIASLPPQERGYAFETFLRRSFDAAGLAAREPFRILESRPMAASCSGTRPFCSKRSGPPRRSASPTSMASTASSSRRRLGRAACS